MVYGVNRKYGVEIYELSMGTGSPLVKPFTTLSISSLHYADLAAKIRLGFDRISDLSSLSGGEAERMACYRAALPFGCTRARGPDRRVTCAVGWILDDC